MFFSCQLKACHVALLQLSPISNTVPPLFIPITEICATYYFSYISPLQLLSPQMSLFPPHMYMSHYCTIALYTLPPFPQREQVQNCFTPCTLHMHTHVSAIPHRQHLVLRLVLKLSYTLSYTWWVCVTLLHCCIKLACTKCECIPHRGHIVLHLVSYKTLHHGYNLVHVQQWVKQSFVDKSKAKRVIVQLVLFQWECTCLFSCTGLLVSS